MSYNQEPTLQELIAGSIDKKKRSGNKVKVVKATVREQTRSFSVKSKTSEPETEIGEEFIDRSQFRNARDTSSDIDPEFLRSLRENFGNSHDSYKKKTKKQEFKLEIADSEFDDLSEHFGKASRVTVRKSGISYNEAEQKKGTRENFQMKKRDLLYDDGFEDYDDEYDEDPDDGSEYDDEYEEYEERPRKKRRIFSKILGFLLLLVIIFVGFVYFMISRYADMFNYVPTENRLEIPNVVSDESVFNLLLIGTDVRASGNGLSDSMILVSVNKDTKQIVMSSFMRDMNVQIPGQQEETWHKLNWAHSKGGAELLMDTLEFNFGIEIDYYAKVDFASFAKIIDAVGGLEIEITDAEAQAMIPPMAEQNDIFKNEKGTDYLYEGGTYHMNGNQALAYARIRKGVGDDFARTDRQREVLELIFKKTKDMELTELNGFIETVIPCITTNMEKQTVKKLMLSTPIMLGYERVSQRVPYGDNYESWSYGSSADGSIIVADFELNKNRLMETIYNR